MHPIHDVDVLILLAMLLSAKRRPAELVEIIAAADLIQGSIPSELKLGEAFQRLSTCGLLCAMEDGFTLTPDAQKIMATQPRKADTQERVFAIKENLSAYNPQGEHAPVLLTQEQLGAAIVAHRSAGKGAGKNLLVAKPKAAEVDSKTPAPGRRQRKPLPSRGRKT